jgi:hypothetical protein
MLPPLPPTFAATQRAVHALAEHVLAVARYGAEGELSLVPTPTGLATPVFGGSRIVEIDRAELVVRDGDSERRRPLTTLRDAAAFVGVDHGPPGGLWTAATNFSFHEPLPIDADSVVALAEWYGLVDDALRALGGSGVELSPTTLWPEHFDLAAVADRVNYGGSPGDEYVDQPYLYVGPFDRPFPHADDAYWNAPFGAVLHHDQIDDAGHAAEFFRHGRMLTAGR